jgi:hypothetical protein
MKVIKIAWHRKAVNLILKTAPSIIGVGSLLGTFSLRCDRGGWPILMKYQYIVNKRCTDVTDVAIKHVGQCIVYIL